LAPGDCRRARGTTADAPFFDNVVDGLATRSCQHDADGNLTTRSIVGGTQTTYTWDVSNRLSAVTVGGGVVFQASYDYRTRRLLKTESGSTTYFVYDGGVSIQERPSGQGTPSAEFVYGGGLGAGIGGILYEDRSGTRNHYGYNQVGHTVLTLSASASVTSWRQYEAFGNSAGGSSGTPTNRLANTREKDAASGLYNHGFRYYDPLAGRYVSRDPIGYGDGMNLYQYVGGNPVNGFDPVGLWEEDAMLEKYFETYGEKGYALYQSMVKDGYSFAKRDYWFDDWAREDDNKVFGIASSWWVGADDSNETAAAQFHQALSETYDTTASNITKAAGALSPITGMMLNGSEEELEAIVSSSGTSCRFAEMSSRSTL
jgi:RHS repeat-associated protein